MGSTEPSFAQRFGRWIAWFDRWIPPAWVTEGGTTLSRGRLTLALTLVTWIETAGSAVFDLLGGYPVEEIVTQLVTLVALPFVFPLVRTSRDVNLGAIVLLVTGYVPAVGAIALTGGGDSPLLFMLAFPVMFAPLMQGNAATIAWAIVSALLATAICALPEAAWPFQMHPLPTSARNIHLLAVAPYMFVTAVAMVLHGGLHQLARRREVELAERERAARATAEQANRAKSYFLATISHELRTPMNAIVATAEMLARDELPPALREQAVTIVDASGELIRLIDDLLDVRQAETGRLTLRIAPFAPRELVRSALALLRTATDSPVVIDAAIDDDVPAFLHGDALRLRQVLFNLVGNALKYARHGTIRVRLRESLRIDIDDDGPGLPDEVREALFSPFVRGEHAVASGQRGSGLGLAITRAIIDAMAGTIELHRRDDGGTCFVIQLPLAAASAPTVPARRRRVLVVDDNELNRRVATMLLRRLGDEPHAVASGEDAIAWCAANIPDVVLLDLYMPTLDGFATAEALRALPAMKDIPIVAVTASAVDDDRERAARLGMQAFLEKPLRLEQLENALGAQRNRIAS